MVSNWSKMFNSGRNMKTQLSGDDVINSDIIKTDVIDRDTGDDVTDTDVI